jgi:hypothetical protein
MRVSTVFIIFTFYMDSIHATPFTSNLILRDIVFCDGPKGPSEQAGCSRSKAKPCCTDANHLATCINVEGSGIWDIQECDQGVYKPLTGTSGVFAIIMSFVHRTQRKLNVDLFQKMQ